MSTITHTRGDSFDVPVTLRINGDIQDLTGWQIRAQMRRPPPQKTLIWAFDPIPLDLAEGRILLSVPFATTEAWAPGDYDCDIELTSPAGWRRSTPMFKISVQRDVSRT